MTILIIDVLSATVAVLRIPTPISKAFAESTVNQVISKRMVKKQQMRWTECGAHLLLQVRTRVLNEAYRGTFHRWYPDLKADPAPGEEAPA